MAISLKELSERIAASIPVGTIVAYHGTSAPSGWLICDGRSCAGTALANLIGNNVPDLRGRFIRMIGGNAADMGMAQEDCIRNITGRHGGHAYKRGSNVSDSTGCFVGTSVGGGGAGQDGNVGCYMTDFDASKSVPTGPENRPINMAFNYIIRAIAYYAIVFLSHLNTKFGGERR